MKDKELNLRIEVRNSGGMKLGDIRVMDPAWLRNRRVKYVRALNTRYYGAGLIQSGQLDELSHEDLSFQSLELNVSEWMERPQIGANGTYRPGRVDFCLIWDGPVEALRDVRDFTPL